MNRILTNGRTSPWSVEADGIVEAKDQAKPTYNGIRAGTAPYTDRRHLDYGSVKEVNSPL